MILLSFLEYLDCRCVPLFLVEHSLIDECAKTIDCRFLLPGVCSLRQRSETAAYEDLLLGVANPSLVLYIINVREVPEIEKPSLIPASLCMCLCECSLSPFHSLYMLPHGSKTQASQVMLFVCHHMCAGN